MGAIKFFSLSNGLRVAIEAMASVRSVGVSLMTPAGSAREPAHLEGLGALWSELLLRGAGDLDSKAQTDAFDRLGASRGVSSRTLFVTVTSRAMGTRLNDVLALVSTMVREPRFDPASIEASRELAIQSLLSLKDDPRERCALLAREHHLPPPINRTGYGRVETLRAITRDDLIREWARLAVADGSILAIAGDVDPVAASDAIERIFGDWSGSIPDAPLDPVGERGYHHETDDTNQVQIDVVHDAPRAGDPDAVLERVVQSVLSGGMSGRLFSEVREKRGLCYAVQSSYGPSRDYGTVSAYVGTTPERAQESLDVLLSELERINTEADVSEDEFARAIVGMKSRTVFAGESTMARASALAGDVHRLGSPRTLAEIASEIDAVTLPRVIDYLRRRNPGKLTIQTLGPAPLAARL